MICKVFPCVITFWLPTYWMKCGTNMSETDFLVYRDYCTQELLIVVAVGKLRLCLYDNILCGLYKLYSAQASLKATIVLQYS